MSKAKARASYQLSESAQAMLAETLDWAGRAGSSPRMGRCNLLKRGVISRRLFVESRMGQNGASSLLLVQGPRYDALRCELESGWRPHGSTRN